MAIPPDAERVFLVGPRASGKTTCGRLLAERLGWEFVDCDEAVEESTGKSVADLFAADGEAAFRDQESQVLEGLTRRQRTVVATGGGMVMRRLNRQRLAESGFVVWLSASPEVLCRRAADDRLTPSRRPALGDSDLVADMDAMLTKREALYREVASLAVDTTGRTPGEVVGVILA